jgi:hypothetical protein
VVKKLLSTAWGAEGAREQARFFDRRVLTMPPVVRLYPRRREMGVEAPVVPLLRPRPPRWRPEPPDEVA